MRSKSNFIELVVRLSDGTFETKVQVPLICTDKQRRSAIDRWLDLAATAMRLGVENLEVQLSEEPAND